MKILSRTTLPLMLFVLAAGLLAVAPVAAEMPRVVARLGPIEITTLDLEADLQRLTPQQREQVLKQPDGIRRIAGNLLYWRTIAAEAEAARALDNPLLATRVQQVRERALAELYLVEEDQRLFPAERVEALARTEYTASPERFNQPEEIRARHILVAKSRDEVDVRERLTEIRKALAAGRPFEEIAEEYSDDGSASRGGDLGYFGRGRMVPPFEQAAFALEAPGAVSDTVESPFGWHVIRLEDRRAPGIKPFDEVKSALVTEIRAKLMRETRQKRANDLQTNPEVVVNDDVIEAFRAKPR